MLQKPRPVSRKIRMINNKFKELFDRNLQRYNLTTSQMDVLIYLACNGGKKICQRDIERWFQLKNPTVTGLLNRLERKGFLRRRVGEDDRRYRVIELTEKSRQLLEEMGEEMTEMDERIYGCLSEDEQETLMKLLDRILDHLPQSGGSDPEDCCGCEED